VTDDERRYAHAKLRELSLYWLGRYGAGLVLDAMADAAQQLGNEAVDPEVTTQWHVAAERIQGVVIQTCPLSSWPVGSRTVN